MTQSQLIQKIENQITEIKQLTDDYKKQIANKENLLQSLAKELSQIKNTMNLNNNQNNAENSEINK